MHDDDIKEMVSFISCECAKDGGQYASPISYCTDGMNDWIEMLGFSVWDLDNDGRSTESIRSELLKAAREIQEKLMIVEKFLTDDGNFKLELEDDECV